MANDTKHSGHATDTTSHPQAAPLSETEFLAREASAAREAMGDTIEDMRTSMRDVADVRGWAQTYPWATLGAAAAAGFLAVVALKPKRREEAEAEEEPALLERILADEQIASRIKEIAEEDYTKPKRTSTLQSVAGMLLKTFGPAIQSAISTALAARAAAPGPEEVAEAEHNAAEQSDRDEFDPA